MESMASYEGVGVVYTCSICGEPINELEDTGVLVRTCEHEGGPVAANIRAHAVGVGSCSPPSSNS